MPRTYVDNAYNRRIGRVGMPVGSMVVTGSGYITTRYYVDNAQNRKLDRVGEFRGSMPEYECDPYTSYYGKYDIPKHDYGYADVLTKQKEKERVIAEARVKDTVATRQRNVGTATGVARCVRPGEHEPDTVNVKTEPRTLRLKTEPGNDCVKTEPNTVRLKTEQGTVRVKTEPFDLYSCEDEEARSRLHNFINNYPAETIKAVSEENGDNDGTIKEKIQSLSGAMADSSDPPERDTKDYRFQQLCKVRIADAPDSVPLERGSGIQTASKYGLTFVAMPTGFRVLRTEDFISQDARHSADRLQHVITDFPVLASVTIGEKVTHVTLSCDDLTLAVATRTTDHAFLHMYDVRNFAGQVSSPVLPFLKVNVAGNTAVLLDLAWNPVSPKLLVTCLSNGRLDMYEIADTLTVRASTDKAKARCVCWSPKGKQLVVGREDGLLVQYDPDFNLKRKWDYPNVFPDQSYQAMDVMWLTNYSFMVAYISSGADCSDQPTVLIINGQKEGPASYISFEDACFGRGEERERKYFFHFIQRWNMLVSGSSNASEITVIGKHFDSQDAWERWNLDDACRAECPLTDSYEDTFPLGIAVDYSSQTPIPLGDEKIHPPSPLLLVLSTEGLIIPYYMVYLHKDAPALTQPGQALDMAGLRKPMAASNGSIAAPRPSTAVKNLFGSLSTQPSAAAAASFSPAQPPTNPTLPKPVFNTAAGDQSALKSALASTSRPGFETGQSGLGFTASTPKSGPGASFSFTPSAGAPSAPATTPGFSFGQNAASGPSSSFLPKSTAAGSTVSDAAPIPGTSTLGSGVGALGSLLGSKPAESSAQTGSFQFKVGAPVSTQQAAGRPQLSTTTATVAPFGAATTSAPPFSATFGSSTAGSAKGFGAAATGSSAGFGTATFGAPAGPGSALGSAAAATTSSVSLGAPASTTAPFGGAGFSLSKPATPAATSGFGFAKPAVVGTAAAISTSEPPTAAAVTTKPVALATASSAPAMLPGTSSSGKSTLSGTLHKSSTVSGLASIGQAETSKELGPAPALPVGSQDGRKRRSPDLADTSAPPTSQSVDHSFSRSILDEIQHFEQELADLKGRSARTDFTIGSQDEMARLKKQTEDINLYCGEIKQTMQDLNKDIQDESSFCLDLFSSVEESRMRQQMMLDPKYHHLLKTRPLDPGSADKLQTLQQQYQVLDQGLRDVDLILDTQWEDYQNKKKNKANRMQAPTNDAVYRVVKSNHNIITAQKSKLGQLEERLKQLKLYNQTVTWNTSTFNNSGDKPELSTLADSLVSNSPVKAPSHSSSRESTVGADKLARLRDHLYRRHVPVVKSTRPENLSMSKIALEDSQLWRSPDTSRTVPKSATAATAAAVSAEPNISQRQAKPGMMGQTMPGAAPVNQGYTMAATAASRPGSGLPPVQNIMAAAQAKQGFGQTSVKLKPDTAASVLSGKGFGLGNTGGRGFGLADTSNGKGFGLGDTGGKGFGVAASVPPQQQKQAPQMPVVVTHVREINGITVEDITPSGSDNEVEETEEDEYDEEEDSSSSGGNGLQGFGPQYNIPATGALGGTPIISKLGGQGKGPDSAKTGGGNTPVGRKLFGNDEPKQDGAFKFNVSNATPASSFSFGDAASSDSSKDKENKAATSAAAGKPLAFGQPASTAAPFSFGQQTSSSSGQFSFGQSATSGPAAGQSQGFQFGTAGTAGSDGDKAGFKFGAPSTAAAGFTALSSTSAPSLSQATASAGLSTVSQPAQGRSASPQVTSLAAAGSGSRPTQSTGVVAQPSDADSSTGPAVVAPSVVARSTRDEVASESSRSSQGGSLSGSQGSSSDGTSKPSLFGQSVSSTTPSFSFAQATAEASKVSSTTDDTNVSSPADTSKVATASDCNQSVQAATNGSASSPTGLFGKSALSTASSGASLFGKSAASSTSGLFGSSASSAPTTGQFGSSISSAPTTGLFGSSTAASSGGFFGVSAASTAGSTLFSAAVSTSVSPPSGLFGTQASSAASSTDTPAASTPTPASSGTPAAPASTSASSGLFGQPGSGFSFATTTTSATGPGLFGQPSGSSGSGLFGQPASSAATAASPFGQATSSAGGLFGTPASSGVGSGSLFGSSTTPTTAAPSGLFGQQSATSGSGGGSGGLFGSSTTTTTAAPSGLFGQQTSSTSGNSGGGSGGLFGSSSPSGFGTAATSGAGFGASTSGSGFGFGQSSSPGFGQAPSFGQTSSAGSPFGSSGSGGDGGMLSGLGGKPSEEKAGTNVFGSGQSFGSASTSSGLFGAGGQTQAFGGGTGTAGSPGAGPFSGGGAFSGGSQGVASTGFSGLAQQTQGGFGSAPSFGSPPAFGGAAFGSAPKFGGSPGFGAGTTGFGGAPTFGSGATFGSPSTSGAQSTGFAGFASAGSPTFGALAQSADAPAFGAMAQGGGEGGFGGVPGATGGGGGGFGSPPFGGGQQTPGFGGGSGGFGSSPSFTGYRG